MIPFQGELSSEAQARRRFGLWAFGGLIVLLPAWWLGGADVFAAVLKPWINAILYIFGLSVTDADQGWRVTTPLTHGGQAYFSFMGDSTIKRLSLGLPLATALFLAPPRAGRPLRVAAITLATAAALYPLMVAAVVWADLAVLLDPARSTAAHTASVALDQQKLFPLATQIAILSRYISLSIAPVLMAALLWALMNPRGRRTLTGTIFETKDAIG